MLQPSRGLAKPQLTYRSEAQNPVMVFNEKRREKKRKTELRWRAKRMQEAQDNELKGGSPDGREMDRRGFHIWS